jgi:aryl-alcohol dehydrogenase
MKSQAVISGGPAAPFELCDVEIDGPRDDEILVKLVATGICHTDLYFKNLLPEALGPCVFGHEGAGVVEAVGRDVDGVRTGDHVILSYRSCGECRRCSSGQPAYCVNAPTLNAPGLRSDGSARLTRDGAPVLSDFFGQSSFARHALSRAQNAVVIDADVPLAPIAALGCGFQTGVGAVLNALSPTAESRLVIYGVGSVGFSALLAARMIGVTTIVAVDPVPARRELAQSFGAVVIDPEADAGTALQEALGPEGASHALDTTGKPAVIRKAIENLGARGLAVLVGLGDASLTIDFQDVLMNGKMLRGCIEGDSQIHRFIPELISAFRSGDLPLDRLVTTYQADEINTAIEDQLDGRVIKPVILW